MPELNTFSPHDPPIASVVTREGNVETTLASGTRIIQPSDGVQPNYRASGDRHSLDIGMLVSTIRRAKRIWWDDPAPQDQIYGVLHLLGENIIVQAHITTPGFVKPVIAAVHRNAVPGVIDPDFPQLC